MAEPELLGWVARVANALRRADVPHALAGGLALAVHGHPRATTDIDLVIADDPGAIDRAREALAAIGILQTRRPIVRFRRIAMLRVAAAPDASPEPIAIDLLLAPPALAGLLDRARPIALGDAELRVVSPEDLVLLKLLRSSAQDLVDVRTLAATRRLDRRYLERAARALRILTRLHRALPVRR